MSLGRVNHPVKVHILLFCSHSMCQQHKMPQFSHKSEKETAFVSHLNLDSQSFTSKAPFLGLVFIRGQVSNIGRKKMETVFFLQSLVVLPMVQDLDFDNKKESPNIKRFPNLVSLVLVFSSPLPNTCFITRTSARITCCLIPTLNQKALSC